MNCTILQGDALELLRTLPPESVHTCVTSPPYYNLRDYGVEGQIGNEGSVEEYLQALVAVFREVRRVLRPDGTLWVNVGDSYATKSGSQPPTNTRNSCGHTAKRVPQGYKKKDLIGIPWQLAFALRADGWYLRQDIIWQKPNCMPESVNDRCTRSHEYIFLLSKSERYYFDAAAISEPVTSAKGNARTFRGGGAYTGGRSHDNSAQVERESHGNSENKAGRMCQFCETPCNNGLNCSDCAHEGKTVHDVLLCTGFNGSMEQYTKNWKRKQMAKLGGERE